MRVQAQVQRVVDAAAEDVFAVLADASSYARWVCGTREIRGFDPQWPQVGARLWHRFGRWPLRACGSTTVTACEPPHVLVMLADATPLALVRATITVRAGTSRRCVVHIREEMIGGRLRIFGPVTALVQHWRNAASLRRLGRIARLRGPVPGRTAHR